MISIVQLADPILPPVRYMPQDWYYIIGGDQANVYSSSRLLMVPVSDYTYQEWLAAKAPIQPMPFATMRDLEVHMSGAYPRGTLKSYNGFSRYNREVSGVVVNSITPIPFTTDFASRNAMANANEYVKITPGSTVNWKMSDGSFVNLNAAQLTTVTTNMATFLQNCFNCENANVTAIDGGTLTTLQQIDDAFAAISNVF